MTETDNVDNTSTSQFTLFPYVWPCGTVVLVKACCYSLFVMGTPHYSDRLCSDRRYSDSTCTVWMSCGWLQLNRPTGSTDWKDAEPNPENQGQYGCVVVLCNFSGVGGTPVPLGYPSQAPLPSVTSVPRSMPCFWCIQRLYPFQFLPNFYMCQAC